MRIFFLLLPLLLGSTNLVFAQFQVQSEETVSYGLSKILLRFSLPKGQFIERENPYISITPITQIRATVYKGVVSYGSRYPVHWRIVRDSSALLQDASQLRETYLLVIEGKLDIGKYRILYTYFPNPQQKVIDSTVLTVSASGIVQNLGKKAFYGRALNINNYALSERMFSGNKDVKKLWNNVQFSFRLDSAEPRWYKHTQEQISPVLPASATRVELAAYWRYPETGEKLMLHSYSQQIEQIPPVIDSRYIRVANIQHTFVKEKARMLINAEVEGLRADVTNVSISALPGREDVAVFADSTSVRWVSSSLDVSSSTLNLKPVKEPSAKLHWNVSDATVRLTEFRTRGVNARFHIEISDIPIPKKPEIYTLQGNVVLRVAASVKNPLNGKVSAENHQRLEIPLNVTITSNGQALRTDSVVAYAELSLDSQRFNSAEEIPPQKVPNLPKQDFIVLVGNSSLSRRLSEEYQNPTLRRIYALFGSSSKGNPKFKGIIATTAPSRQDLVNPDWVQALLAEPVLVLSPEELRTIPTKVFLQDDSTGAKIPVRGSIEYTDHETMLAFVLEEAERSLENTPTRLFVKTVSNPIRKRQSVVITKEVNLETSGDEVLMIAADSLLVRRFSEVCTPGIPRTPVLDIAEKECSNAAEIKRLIAAKEPIPQHVIDETSSPTDCEAVKSYYLALQSLRRIKSVYILVAKKGLKQGNITIVGTLSYTTERAQPESLSNYCRLTFEDLRHFKTKEFEKDYSTGMSVAVKGSMATVPFEYCAEYCLDYVQKRLKQGLGENDFAAIPVFINGQGGVQRVVQTRSTAKKP
ncbi:MAG: hypothetical protein MUF71_08500 [Candidatus Kapabacteria bacterium]|jgi:hypothetical protein|nr:hypothetical protein [Candidatus Kapabacteria bacterium]